MNLLLKVWRIGAIFDPHREQALSASHETLMNFDSPNLEPLILDRTHRNALAVMCHLVPGKEIGLMNLWFDFVDIDEKDQKA